MDAERYTAAVDSIENGLKERYNVRELPEHLASAVAAARDGDLEPVAAVLAGREMYRWREAVDEGLAAAKAALEGEPVAEAEAPAPDAPGDEPVNLESLSYKDLQALAASKGLQSVGISKDALIESIRAS